ncbi:MAG: excinuclease ABC subunit B, partial [Candidatus Aminicenantes bacterium]
LTSVYERDYLDYTQLAEDKPDYLSREERQKRIEFLEKEMKKAAQNLEFERAAALRDELKKLKRWEIEIGP